MAIRHTAPASLSPSLEEAFTNVRRALQAQREAGYRLGRSISAEATEDAITAAATAASDSDGITAEAWASLYLAVAAAQDKAAAEAEPIPYTLSEEKGRILYPAESIGEHRGHARCWCGSEATFVQPVDPTITAATWTMSDGEPGLAVCAEHLTADGYERV